MTGGAPPALQRCTQNRMACVGRNIQRRAIGLGLLGRQPLIINAIQPVGVDMPLKALHIMHIMREHHDTALGIHDVVIQLLA